MNGSQRPPTTLIEPQTPENDQDILTTSNCTLSTAHDVRRRQTARGRQQLILFSTGNKRFNINFTHRPLTAKRVAARPSNAPITSRVHRDTTRDRPFTATNLQPPVNCINIASSTRFRRTASTLNFKRPSTPQFEWDRHENFYRGTSRHPLRDSVTITNVFDRQAARRGEIKTSSTNRKPPPDDDRDDNFEEPLTPNLRGDSATNFRLPTSILELLTLQVASNCN